MFAKMKKYLKGWWKRNVADMVPKNLEDLF